MALDAWSLALRVLVCSQLVPVLPLGGCISMWVAVQAVVDVCCDTCCFSLCVYCNIQL